MSKSERKTLSKGHTLPPKEYEYIKSLSEYHKDYDGRIAKADLIVEMENKHNALIAEKEELLKKRDELLSEKEELLKKRDELLSEKEELLKKRDELLSEKEELVNQVSALNEHEIKLCAEYSALKRQIECLIQRLTKNE